MVLQLLCTEMPGEGPQERAWWGGSHRPLLCSPPLVVARGVRCELQFEDWGGTRRVLRVAIVGFECGLLSVLTLPPAVQGYSLL